MLGPTEKRVDQKRQREQVMFQRSERNNSDPYHVHCHRVELHTPFRGGYESLPDIRRAENSSQNQRLFGSEQI